MENTVYDFLDIFMDEDMQVVSVYDVNHGKELFRGVRTDMPDDIRDLEIQSIDNLHEPTTVLTLNVAV